MGDVWEWVGDLFGMCRSGWVSRCRDCQWTEPLHRVLREVIVLSAGKGHGPLELSGMASACLAWAWLGYILKVMVTIILKVWLTFFLGS